MRFAAFAIFAVAALVVACAPVQPVARQVVFVDALTGCRYVLADGRRVNAGPCSPVPLGARR